MTRANTMKLVKAYKKWTPKVAPSVKRYVAKAIDRATEDKQAGEPLATNFGSISSGWNELALTQITQGDGASQRLGNRIKVKSLEVKGVITGGMEDSVADDPYNAVRVIIALWNDKQTSPCATAGLGIDSIINSINSGTGKLRKKFYDKYIALSGSARGDDGKILPVPKNFHYYKQFKKPMYIQFTGDSNDYPNQTLVMSAISDSGLVVHPGFIVGYINLKYEDA